MTAPPRLDQDDLSWLVLRASERIGQEIGEMARAAGITDHRHWLVLAAIADREPRTQLELANELSLDKTTLMAIVDRLERDGLVLRTSCPTDRRVKVPKLTDAGRRVCESIRVEKDAIIARRLAHVPEADRQKLCDALTCLCGEAQRATDRPRRDTPSSPSVTSRETPSEPDLVGTGAGRSRAKRTR